jgi:hypothetical protein
MKTAEGDSWHPNDWKGEIHEWENDLYWGGDRPVIEDGTFLRLENTPSQNVSFHFDSLEGATDVGFDGKFAFYESQRKAGRDVSSYAGWLTHSVGVDGSPASTWLPYALWEKCKSAGIKGSDCSKGRYDFYVEYKDVVDGGGTSPDWSSGGGGSMQARTTPPTTSYWDRKLWGHSMRSVAAVGGAVGFIVLALMFLVVFKAST